jgi:hypothetical protein
MQRTLCLIRETVLRRFGRVVVAIADGRLENFGQITFSGHFVLFEMLTRAARAAALKLLADEGNAAAQFGFGLCLMEGDGVNVDDMQACEYFKQSGDGGDSDRQILYGECLERGTGVSILHHRNA